MLMHSSHRIPATSFRHFYRRLLLSLLDYIFVEKDWNEWNKTLLLSSTGEYVCIEYTQ